MSDLYRTHIKPFQAISGSTFVLDCFLATVLCFFATFQICCAKRDSNMWGYFSRKRVKIWPQRPKAPKGIHSPATSSKSHQNGPQGRQNDPPETPKWNKMNATNRTTKKKHLKFRGNKSCKARHGGGSSRSELDIYIYIYILFCYVLCVCIVMC